MNVVVSNKFQNELSNLDIDIIKSVSGTYGPLDIIEMFKNFFYSKMIIDVTAISNYQDYNVYNELSKGLDCQKIIFLLPEGSSLCKPSFLSRLIDYGIYNFTTNINGIKYLLNKTNTLQDVQHIKDLVKSKVVATERNDDSDLDTPSKISSSSNKSVSQNKYVTGSPVTKVSSVPSKGEPTILGFKDITEHAGSTTLIYVLKKELVAMYGKDSVVCVEVGKNDFSYFDDKAFQSVSKEAINTLKQKYATYNIVLVDMNDSKESNAFDQVFYLVEPSTIKLNKLVRRNREILNELSHAKIILNKSLLLNNDVRDFEAESGLKVFYNMPPLDERKRNSVVSDFLAKIGFSTADGSSANRSNRIFGLFRK